LFARQFCHSIQEGRRIGPLRRPLHTLEDRCALLHLGHQLLFLLLDGLRQALSLRPRLSHLCGKRAPLGYLEEQKEHEENSDQYPGNERNPRLHYARSASRIVMCCSGPLPSGAGGLGLISQLFNWKRLLTAGSRMIPAMNWATSSSGGLPGRSGVTASMRSTFSGLPVGAPCGPDPAPGTLVDTSTL